MEPVKKKGPAVSTGPRCNSEPVSPAISFARPRILQAPIGVYGDEFFELAEPGKPARVVITDPDWSDAVAWYPDTC